MIENNNVQAGLVNASAKIDAKAELNASANMHNQIGGTTTYNNDNSQQIMQQNFITILPVINANEYVGKALALENENANEVSINVKKLLKENNISEELIQEKLSNPEFIETLRETYNIAKVTNDVEKRKILSDLIFKKIQEDVDTEDSTNLSLAIQEMDILSLNHIKAISFLYLIKSNYLKNYTVNELNKFYNEVLSIIFNFKNSNARAIGEFLASTRTISAAHIGWDITSYLPQILTNKNDASKIIQEEYTKWHVLWNDLGFMGAYITPVGRYIAKIYLYNTFGIVVNDNISNENNIKDLSDDVSAKELANTSAKITIRDWK